MTKINILLNFGVKNNIVNNEVKLQPFHFDKDEYQYINERK